MGRVADRRVQAANTLSFSDHVPKANAMLKQRGKPLVVTQGSQINVEDRSQQFPELVLAVSVVLLNL